MTLRQLEIFLAVGREGNFTRAARALRLSQPTLSEHVRELERELGRPLFVRRKRSVTLTEAGRVFEPHARSAVQTVGDGRLAVQELDGLARGSLLIGAGTTPGIYVLPETLAAFAREYPGIDVTLRIANSRAIEEQIRSNQLDLGIVGGHGLAPGERCVAAGLVDELMLIVPRGHRWARSRVVGATRFGEERLLTREPGSATREVMERALQRAGVTIGRTMELDHTEAIKQGVMAGLGVAFVSIHAVRGELASRRLVAVRLRGVRIRRHFHVIHSELRGMTASARALTRLLEERARRTAR
jgi:DNA-binding transcriptional LysR family regulator